jgi:hypothetical protein
LVVVAAPPLAVTAAVPTPLVEVICTAPPAPPGRFARRRRAAAAARGDAEGRDRPTPASVTLPALRPAWLALAAPPELAIAPVTLRRPLLATASIVPPRGRWRRRGREGAGGAYRAGPQGDAAGVASRCRRRCRRPTTR